MEFCTECESILHLMKHNKLFCKKCNSLLIPGETSNTRLKSNKKQPSYIVHKCLFCGNCRKNYI